MTLLLNGDCLELLDTLEPQSVDLIFCDLPYGQTSCKWDTLIDLEQLWSKFMRVKKLNTPIIMTCTTKFGVSLIQSAPKRCPFRYDLVWCKSASAGFLSARKQPLRKHEMIYVFYEKLPFYNLSSHKHKFVKENNISEDIVDSDLYNTKNRKKPIARVKNPNRKKDGDNHYDPPLPDSLVKEDIKSNNIYDNQKVTQYKSRKGGESNYDPPLPDSLLKEDVYGADKEYKEKCYDERYGAKGKNQVLYDPPLPDSLLEIKSTRGKHSTEKPVALMEWILKYYSKEGDVVLDPTMGSGSMGVACDEMNRNFIGIEKDEEIFNVAYERINPEI